MRLLKNIGKKVLPPSCIFFYHSVRAASKLRMVGALLKTLRNSGRKIRLGGEAGWNIPRGAISSDSICYCVGCGEDITFDLELIKTYSCGIFAFDPTPRAIAHVKKYASHLPSYKLAEVAIWDKEEKVKFYAPDYNDVGVSHSITNLNATRKYIEVQAKRLKQIIESNDHSSLALFKMDIEGAEHTVIRTIIEDKIDIHILCVEFDELAAHATPERLASIHRSIQRLIDYGFDLFWMEGSNFTFVNKRFAAGTRRK